MTDADHHTIIRKVTGQCKILIGFGGHGDIADVALGRFLISLELFYSGFNNMLLRLCTLVLHVQIRTFKVDAQNFRTFVAIFHDLGHIHQCIGQHFLALCNGCCQESSDTLVHNILGPIPQTCLMGIVGIECVSTMAVDIDETGYNSLVTIVNVHRSGTIRSNGNNLALFHFNHRRNKLVSNPNFFALNNHNNYLYYLLSVYGSCHTAISMANTANCNGISLNIFRQ